MSVVVILLITASLCLTTGITYDCGDNDIRPFNRTTGSGGPPADLGIDLMATGGPLLYSSFFGGNDVEFGNMAIVNDDGEMILVGYTDSADLPVTNDAPQGRFGGDADAFIAKFSADGTSLQFCTYLGGSGYDGATSVQTDSAGHLYVCGVTNSTDFQTTSGCYQSAIGGGYDTFLCKIDPDTGTVLFSTLLGGSGDDGERTEGGRVITIQVDSAGRAWLAGSTDSSDLPVTTGCYQKSLGGYGDGYVCRFNNDGSRLEMCTYLGGTSDDLITDCLLGSDGKLVVVGATRSRGFPTTQGVYQTMHLGSTTGFITRFTANDQGVEMSTFLGSAGSDVVMAANEGSNGKLYLVGYTESATFPTTAGAYQTVFKGDFSGFVCQMSNDGAKLNWSTFMGGSDADMAICLSL